MSLKSKTSENFNDSNTFGTFKSPKPLPNGFVPGPMDVICARGKTAYNHPGNCRYRELIKIHVPLYSNAKSKLEKSLIVSSILESVREESTSGVGFVQAKDGWWFEVTEHCIRDKIGQSFRDLLHTKYSSSSKMKKLRQKKCIGKSTWSSFDNISSVHAIPVETKSFTISNVRCCSAGLEPPGQKSKVSTNQMNQRDAAVHKHEPAPFDQAPCNILSSTYGRQSIPYTRKIRNTMNTGLDEKCLGLPAAGGSDPIPIEKAKFYPFFIDTLNNKASDEKKWMPCQKELLNALSSLWDKEDFKVLTNNRGSIYS